MQGQEIVGLSEMRALEVGGSLPRELVIDTLGATQWVALEALRYWAELGDSGGGTRPIADLSTQIHEVSSLSEITQYTILEGRIEDLPKCMEEAFDRIFSIACFEHMHTLGLALEKMHAALALGGKLFTMFSPIWSAHDGHHLPIMRDLNGTEWSYANSPIPP